MAAKRYSNQRDERGVRLPYRRRDERRKPMETLESKDEEKRVAEYWHGEDENIFALKEKRGKKPKPLTDEEKRVAEYWYGKDEY